MSNKQQNDSWIEETVIARLSVYLRMDAAEQRRELVKKWRAAHPEAVNEISSVLKPLILMDDYEKQSPDHPDEYWHNDTYTVSVRRHLKDTVFNGCEMVQLGISRLDGTACHDWRDFQSIKNQLVGEETEAFELYPATSRLMDPSNYYSLWCFPSLSKIRVGTNINRVFNASEALAPQRRFPHEKE